MLAMAYADIKFGRQYEGKFDLSTCALCKVKWVRRPAIGGMELEDWLWMKFGNENFGWHGKS